MAKRTLSSEQGCEETYFNDTGYLQRIFIVVATAVSGGAAYNARSCGVTPQYWNVEQWRVAQP